MKKAKRITQICKPELEDRLKSGKAIDSVSQELHVLETQHWKAILSRIIAIVCHLAEHNQALRGHSEKLFKPHNGNFLGQVELMAQFDPIMSEHLRRIEKKGGKGKGKGSGVWPSMVNHTRNLSSAFNPSKCTLTAVNTHLEQ